MIHDEIVTYEVAKLAKEKGFDWDCPMFYNPEGELEYGWAYDPMNSGLDMRDMLCHNSKLPLGFGAECSAPTQSLLQKWLREEKRINICIDSDLDFNEEDYIYEWQLSHKKDLGDGCYRIITESDMEFYPTYEEALETSMKYALENWL